jgi:hypothetical protein
MCSKTDWNLGSWTAVIVAVFVALGGVEGVADAFAALPRLVNGASACIDKICISI